MNIRKFGFIFATIGVALIALAPIASATSDNHPGDLPNGTHLKVDICHNVDHNPVLVPVSVDSADYPFDTGHGDLTLDENHGFVSFEPHTGTGGHEHDYVVRVYTKHGDDETNTYLNELGCGNDDTTTTTEPTTTTTQPEVTTTTTEPVVTTTTTTQPSVVTTTTTKPETLPVVVPAITHDCTTPEGFGYDTNEPNCGVAQPIVAPANTPAVPVEVIPATELAHTGTGSLVLAGLGLVVTMTGLIFLLLSFLSKRFNSEEA